MANVDERLKENVTFKRWYFDNEDNEYYKLHTFLDAGKKAAATVAYLLIANGNTKRGLSRV